MALITKALKEKAGTKNTKFISAGKFFLPYSPPKAKGGLIAENRPWLKTKPSESLQVSNGIAESILNNSIQFKSPAKDRPPINPGEYHFGGIFGEKYLHFLLYRCAKHRQYQPGTPFTGLFQSWQGFSPIPIKHGYETK